MAVDGACRSVAPREDLLPQEKNPFSRFELLRAVRVPCLAPPDVDDVMFERARRAGAFTHAPALADAIADETVPRPNGVSQRPGATMP